MRFMYEIIHERDGVEDLLMDGTIIYDEQWKEDDVSNILLMK